jgi:hypothetical protein
MANNYKEISGSDVVSLCERYLDEDNVIIYGALVTWALNSQLAAEEPSLKQMVGGVLGKNQQQIDNLNLILENRAKN